MTGHPAPAPFGLSQDLRDDGTTVVSVSGELGIVSAPVLREALDVLAGERRTVVVDLREVSFMDSSGLNLLIRVKQRAHGDGGSIRVAPDIPAQVARLFELTATTDYLLSE
ncbi:STAS domain-containing protein [Baekduia soli]|nr:STAS domain-containing protein [Baekduia soli]